MKSKQSVALFSASALAAGMAQGAVVYSGPLNLQQNYNSNDSLARQPVDMTGDAVSDFTFGYEESATKPYVDVRTYVSPTIPVQSGMVSVLGKANKGLPVTPAGTMIDASSKALKGTAGQRHAARIAVLGVGELDQTALNVDLRDAQPEDFVASHPSRHRQQHDVVKVGVPEIDTGLEQRVALLGGKKTLSPPRLRELA